MKLTIALLIAFSAFGQTPTPTASSGAQKQTAAPDPKDEKLKAQAAKITWQEEYIKVLLAKIESLTGVVGAQINQRALESQKPPEPKP